MFNPPGLPPELDSSQDIRRRVLQRVQSAKVEDQILKVVQRAYENALTAENLVLSRSEQKSMLAEILKTVLDGMSKQLGGGSIAV